MMERLSGLLTAFGRSGLVLAYHDILPDRRAVYPYAVRESTFLRHLDMVQALGLRPVTLAEFTDNLLAGDASGLVAVVFDDAIVGVHRIAMPRLAERSIPWTLLPVTDRTGVDPDWWPEADRTMTRVEIAEALDSGAALCGHTATHVSLPDIPPAKALDELRRSRETLSAWAGREVRDLCYPFGHQTSDVRQLTRDAGYRCGYSFTNGRCHPATDPFAQPRLAMHEELSSAKFLATVIRPRCTWPPVRDLRRQPPAVNA
ncbi:polysaccharide deacetylase family protein [Dietzia kunjamensis]|uniref:polysaccharide deacetylase family protein n=1 Tax=Dietzia kunjamensis TaxID=322509 RepID=UPI002097F8D2|nr:polysaccharide deacetylase family protein [Dietzia kunjamensis]USX47388.1 polysaccharide deacetylase family protein [Dietzia kunjamensis]